MDTTKIKCEVSIEEGSEPVRIKEEPIDEESDHGNSKQPDLSKTNPLMYQANQLFVQKIKLENPEIKLEPMASEEYLESQLKITQERKMRSQEFSANGIEGAEVFSCRMCKSNYVSRQKLDTHIQQSHTTGPGWIHCQLCEYKFRKVNKFNEHMVACHGQFKKLNNTVPEEHNCTLCDFKSSTSFTLVTHMQRVHAERPDANGQFSCENCPFRAATINAIKSHRYLSHFQKNLEDADFDLSKLVSCVVCSSQLPNEELLKKHLQEKHNMSSDRDLILKHPVKKFNCAYCDITFQYWSKLETHEKIKHPDQPSQIENKYQCKKCDFKPMTMLALEVHNKQHSERVAQKVTPKQSVFPKPHVAAPNIKFSNISSTGVNSHQPPLKKVKVNDLPLELTKSKLKNTVYSAIDSAHPKEKKISWFMCTFCPFKTQKEVFFTNHMHKVHNKFGDLEEVKNDNSPWLQCTICSFKTLKELLFINHMQKNHNKFGDLEEAKRYSCRKCDCAFESLLLFVGHKSKCKPVEVGDSKKKPKAFRCAICNERFLEASIMQNHVNSHTIIGPEGVKFYKCPCCEHVYKNPRLLVDHIKNNHRTDNIVDNGPLEKSKDETDPLGTIDSTPSEDSIALAKSELDNLGTNKCTGKNDDSFEDDPEIKELDDILNSFNNENEDTNKLKERNKANIGSDDDGSDTSVDSDDEQEVNHQKGKKTCFSCLYCQEGPKTTFQSKDALMNHQKDIFGLKKTDKFFVRPHLACPHCSFMIQCEVSMSKHVADTHQVQDIKCKNCDFKSNMEAIMNHHAVNNHKDTTALRTCAVCGVVLRDKKNLTGHYFSKHNILDPSKLKKFQTSC